MDFSLECNVYGTSYIAVVLCGLQGQEGTRAYEVLEPRFSFLHKDDYSQRPFGSPSEHLRETVKKYFPYPYDSSSYLGIASRSDNDHYNLSEILGKLGFHFVTYLEKESPTSYATKENIMNKLLAGLKTEILPFMFDSKGEPADETEILHTYMHSGIIRYTFKLKYQYRGLSASEMVIKIMDQLRKSIKFHQPTT